MARVVYLTLFFLNAVVAALLRAYSSYTVLQYSPLLHQIYSDCAGYADSSACFGNQLVYRMSLSVGCFFVLTGLLAVGLSRGYENCCCLLFFQIPFYAAMLFASLFIPSSFFDGYADVARVASGAFIVLQIIIIVDWAYNLRDFFLDKMESEERDEEARQALLESDYKAFSSSSDSSHTTKWGTAYLVVVIILTAISAAGLVIMFNRYAGCDLNIAFIAITIVAMIVVTVFSVLSWVNAGLLPSAAVSSYLVFLCYQAVHSNPDESCTSIDTTSTKHVARSTLMNAALAALTITWTSWRTSATKTNLLTLSPSASSSRVDKSKSVENDDAVPLKDDEVAEVPGSVPEYQFHLLMVLSSFYLAMVVTNWGTSTGTDIFEDQEMSMWVKIISQWLATCIFLWTLVAPSVFPDREFVVV